MCEVTCFASFILSGISNHCSLSLYQIILYLQNFLTEVRGFKMGVDVDATDHVQISLEFLKSSWHWDSPRELDLYFGQRPKSIVINVLVGKQTLIDLLWYKIEIPRSLWKQFSLEKTFILQLHFQGTQFN